MSKYKTSNHKIGIDAIKFYLPKYVLNLSDLAKARGVNSNEYSESYGQEQMSVPSIDEDIVTMSVNAAVKVIKEIDKNDIGFLILATETGIDASKSAGMFVHRLLGLPNDCRVLELKQACYSATGGIALSVPFLHKNPNKKILLIAVDIAKYGISSTAESSGGAAAVAMVLSTNPRILEIEERTGVYTKDNMDFWRPNYREEPILNSKLSCNLYIKFLGWSFDNYINNGGCDLDGIDYFCYHLSVPRLTKTAHKYLYKHAKNKSIKDELLKKHIDASSIYGKLVGNCYTASLYLSFISLLDNSSHDISAKRIAFYSYGSGSIGEFFTGKVLSGYRSFINPEYNKKLINKRKEISVEQYEVWHKYSYPTDGSKSVLPTLKKDGYRLAGFDKHMRKYAKESSG